MMHLGDITKLTGAEIPVVDCITGGSPCQDLSIAGKRAGLAGERSGLFMEQIRIVKEMRNRDRSNGRTGRHVRPRFMVWENVPGAFSSNKGEDFRAALEEIARVEDKNAVIPRPEGGWRPSGCIVGNGWSIAWRVHDAQFWGVPQRRKRIALVADFGGFAAPEILFERKSLFGDPAKGGAPGQGAAADAPGSAGRAGRDIILDDQGGSQIGVRLDGVSPTIRAEMHGNIPAVMEPKVYRKGARPHNAAEPQKWERAEISNTLNAFDVGETRANELVMEPHTYQNVTGPLMANSHPGSYTGQDAYNDMLIAACDVVCGIDARNGKEDGDLCGTLQSKTNGGFSYNCIHPVRVGAAVRRLTTLECERLNGYPDGWTDIGDWVDSKGKKHKAADTPRYKALGNSIALPFWFWLLRRISAQYERPATLGSLFDGIGGFPLCWERCNGKGTAIWASEIEEFPMAVTRVRFSEEGL